MILRHVLHKLNIFTTLNTWNVLFTRYKVKIELFIWYMISKFAFYCHLSVLMMYIHFSTSNRVSRQLYFQHSVLFTILAFIENNRLYFFLSMTFANYPYVTKTEQYKENQAFRFLSQSAVHHTVASSSTKSWMQMCV